MDEREFVERIKEEYDCDQTVAERITAEAKRYHKNRDTDKTVDDWISAMVESRQSNPISAWNWAVSAKDATNWNIGGEASGESPYKINR